MELKYLRGANTEMVQSAGAQVRIGSTCILLLILERSRQLDERTLCMFSGAVGPLQACAASLRAAEISSVTRLACSLATWQAPQLTKQSASWRRLVQSLVVLAMVCGCIRFGPGAGHLLGKGAWPVLW